MKRLPLHAICPYFAMFPESFVREQVEAFSRPGDTVLDPFCGRGTTVLESLLAGREAAGSDISPVAFCVSAAKAERPPLDRVLRNLDSLADGLDKTETATSEVERRSLPPFFLHAFQRDTLNELLYLRRQLNWKTNRSDRFIAALVLGSLHGEMDKSSSYFSNQMPRTICLKPDYSIRYWRERGLRPKRRPVFSMLRNRAELRLSTVPDCGTGSVRQTDARQAAERFREHAGKVSLVVTSPPYLQVTRYEEDQWLRLWFLGGPPRPTYRLVSRDDRHHRAATYWRFLDESWRGIAPLLKSKAILVVRIGGLGISEKEIAAGLRTSLSGAFGRIESLNPPSRTELKHRQARSFLPESEGCRYEMDFAFRVTA